MNKGVRAPRTKGTRHFFVDCCLCRISVVQWEQNAGGNESILYFYFQRAEDMCRSIQNGIKLQKMGYIVEKR